MANTRRARDMILMDQHSLCRPLITDITNKEWGISHFTAKKNWYKGTDGNPAAEHTLMKGTLRKRGCITDCENCDCVCSLAIAATCDKMVPIYFNGYASVPDFREFWPVAYKRDEINAATAQFYENIKSYNFNVEMNCESIGCGFEGCETTGSGDPYAFRASLCLWALMSDLYPTPEATETELGWQIEERGASFSQSFPIGNDGVLSLEVSIGAQVKENPYFFFYNCANTSVGYSWTETATSQNRCKFSYSYSDHNYSDSYTYYIAQFGGWPKIDGTLTWNVQGSSTMPDIIHLNMSERPKICDSPFSGVISAALDQIAAMHIELGKIGGAYESNMIPVFNYPDWYIYAWYTVRFTETPDLPCCKDRFLNIELIQAATTKTEMAPEVISEQLTLVDTMYGDFNQRIIPLFTGEQKTTSSENCFRCTSATTFDSIFTVCDCGIDRQGNYKEYWGNCYYGGKFSVG